jgi:hypothetical protein
VARRRLSASGPATPAAAGPQLSIGRIAPGDRAIFVGLPGSGKTTLVQELLDHGGADGAAIRSAVVIDPKGDPDEWRAWGRRRGWTVSSDPRVIARLPSDPARGPQPQPRVVWLVDSLWISDRQGWWKPGTPGHMWTDGLTRLYGRGHTLAVFDDALHTLPSGGGHPAARKVITMGRSLRVGAWVIVQAPLWVDTLALRTAEHVFAFAQPSEDWRARLEAERGVNCAELATLADREWAYHTHGMPGWEIFAPIVRTGFRQQRAHPLISPSTAPGDQPDPAMRALTPPPPPAIESD